MNQKAFLLIILITILFIYNTHVYPFEKEISGNFFEMETRLKLSKEQSEKLLKIREKYFSDMQRLRYEIFKKNIELKNLYFDAAADESTILNKQKELMDLRQKLEEKRAQMMLEERKVLTPEQLEILNRYPMEKRYERMGPGKGRFRRGFGPQNF